MWLFLDVYVQCLQTYLSSAEFREKFGMTKDAFYKMPKWKQNKLKMALQLFWIHFVPLFSIQLPVIPLRVSSYGYSFVSHLPAYNLFRITPPRDVNLNTLPQSHSYCGFNRLSILNISFCLSNPISSTFPDLGSPLTVSLSPLYTTDKNFSSFSHFPSNLTYPDFPSCISIPLLLSPLTRIGLSLMKIPSSA